MEKDKVIGKALYMELRSGSNTYQMILTPDGMTSQGRNVPATVYRRQISSVKPRRAWKTYALPVLPQDGFGNFSRSEADVALSDAANRSQYVENIFNRLSSYGYALYKTPIVVEVSQADIDEIRHGKTPYKILGRITRLRRHQGFGEKLFA